MKNVLLEILKDCDEDIRTKMLEHDGKYALWEYLENAPLVALSWQQVRNTNRKHESV